MDPGAVFLAPAQSGFTSAFHIVLPAFTIGLASRLAVPEALWRKTGRTLSLLGVLRHGLTDHRPADGLRDACEAFFLVAGLPGVMLCGLTQSVVPLSARAHRAGGIPDHRAGGRRGIGAWRSGAPAGCSGGHRSGERGDAAPRPRVLALLVLLAGRVAKRTGADPGRDRQRGAAADDRRCRQCRGPQTCASSTTWHASSRPRSSWSPATK